jgi:hypothetical protein
MLRAPCADSLSDKDMHLSLLVSVGLHRVASACSIEPLAVSTDAAVTSQLIFDFSEAPIVLQGDVLLQFFLHRGRRGVGDAAGGATGRLQLEQVAFAWLHTLCTVSTQAVTFLPAEEVDVDRRWRAAALDPGFGLACGLQPTSFDRDTKMSNPIFSDD